MSNKLEWTVEEYFIQLLKQNTTLAPLDIRHFDDDDQAEADGLVVEAVRGNRRLDGAKGAYDVNVRVIQRSYNTVSADNELISNAIVDTVYDPAQVSDPDLATIRGQLNYLLILDEMTSDRNNSKSSRHREKVFPVIAL